MSPKQQHQQKFSNATTTMLQLFHNNYELESPCYHFKCSVPSKVKLYSMYLLYKAVCCQEAYTWDQFYMNPYTRKITCFT